jgi:hypothetical protein
MQALLLAAAALAWLGATLTSLAEARRGLALGLALTGVGLAGVIAVSRPLDALLLAGAAVGTALLRLRDGPAGWDLLPAGSTPGIVLSIVVLVASVLLAGTFLQGPMSVWSLAPLAVALVAALRLLAVEDRAGALAAGAALALALAAFGTTEAILTGGLVAVALGAIPAAESQEVVT